VTSSSEFVSSDTMTVHSQYVINHTKVAFTTLITCTTYSRKTTAYNTESLGTLQYKCTEIDSSLWYCRYCSQHVMYNITQCSTVLTIASVKHSLSITIASFTLSKTAVRYKTPRNIVCLTLCILSANSITS